jgi:hypothetical protein
MAGRFELLRREFPDFPLESLPEIPADWDDQSWHNDACPSFEANPMIGPRSSPLSMPSRMSIRR